MMMMPTGFRFNPTEEELIELLFRKVSGQDMHFHGRFILQTDVYDIDPKHLQWDQNLVLSNNERFYYYSREKGSREVSGQGWWRATGHAKKIYANYNNQLLVGFKRALTFYRFRDDCDIERRRKKAIKTDWIMHEYSLESYSTEWRLCKIKCKGKASVQEKSENSRNPSSSMHTEQQQPPQSLQSVFEADFSDFSGGENQQNQQFLPQADGMFGNEPSNLAELNLQMEAFDVEQQQPMSFCDPYYDYFEHYQLQQFTDSSEQLFPSIWSWHADL